MLMFGLVLLIATIYFSSDHQYLKIKNKKIVKRKNIFFISSNLLPNYIWCKSLSPSLVLPTSFNNNNIVLQLFEIFYLKNQNFVHYLIQTTYLLKNDTMI